MLSRPIHSPRAGIRRAGYTLVEMLVAAAVSIMLMVIISTAFQRGLDMFRTLRAQGQMQDRLRMAKITLQDDLAYPHFSAPNSSPDTKKNFLAGQDITQVGLPGAGWTPPADGFFRIVNGAEIFEPTYIGRPAAQIPPYVLDGTDGARLTYTRATRHALHFTVKRFAYGPDQMLRVVEPQRLINVPPLVAFPNQFTAPISYRENNVFSSQWFEVAYFLVPSGTSANGLPLYNLCRRQKLLVPKPADLPNPPDSNANFDVVVAVNGNTNLAWAIPPNPIGSVAPPINPEISTRSDFLAPAPAPVPTQQIYNRTGSITQPRSRFGMMPAHSRFLPDLNPAVNTVTYKNLAGMYPIITTPPVVYSPILKGTRYPALADEYPPNDPFQRPSNDLLLQDVVSFEVKAVWDYEVKQGAFSPAPRPDYSADFGAPAGTYLNTDYPFDFIPQSPVNLALLNIPLPAGSGAAADSLRVFDTWSNAGQGQPIPSPYAWVENPAAPPALSFQRLPMWQRTEYPVNGVVSNPDWTAARLPLRIRVKAIQIRIRIWDFKTEQTRQVTIMQDV